MELGEKSVLALSELHEYSCCSLNCSASCLEHLEAEPFAAVRAQEHGDCQAEAGRWSAALES